MYVEMFPSSDVHDTHDLHMIRCMMHMMYISNIPYDAWYEVHVLHISNDT